MALATDAERAATFLVVAHAVADRGALVMNGDDAAVLRVALLLGDAVALERLLARLGRGYAADGMIIAFRSTR